jgi:magnesium-transporting ATPase (P-type)
MATKIAMSLGLRNDVVDDQASSEHERMLLRLTLTSVVQPQQITASRAGDPLVDWVEGVAIIAAILIVISVSSLNDWQKEKQFEALNEKREECSVKVVHDGRGQSIHVRHLFLLALGSLTRLFHSFTSGFGGHPIAVQAE